MYEITIKIDEEDFRRLAIGHVSLSEGAVKNESPLSLFMMATHFEIALKAGEGKIVIGNEAFKPEGDYTHEQAKRRLFAELLVNNNLWEIRKKEKRQ